MLLTALIKRQHQTMWRTSDASSSPAPQDQRAAASLLGVVLAKRPSIADFLVAEGALKAAVQLLLKGALWQS